MSHPIIIQGGMGAGVSNWRLARAVSLLGQLGVVSGTALDVILARRLQIGDPGGDLRRAMSHFPVPEVAQRALDQYYVPGGKSADVLFRGVPFHSVDAKAAVTELTVLANFVEVFLAKEGQAGVVGINYLEKIQLPTLPSLYGAMLAGVDYILMGAGIPRQIPGILDRLALAEPVQMKIDVEGAEAGEEFFCRFDPQAFFNGSAPKLNRPQFLAIVSSATLAMTLARKASGRVDGFVVEGASAGGHNAPPRGPLQLNPRGEPVYGVRDVADLEKIKALGLPFWLAGSYGDRAKVMEALQAGAAGVQVGTAFAFCEESGVEPALKARILAKCQRGSADVFTDPLASPTGFPFKVLQMEDSLSEAADYGERERVCDLGYLRHVYRKPDGTLGYRCPAEPIPQYLAKGGGLAETEGRKCICNGLVSTIGMGQALPGQKHEKAIITAGDDAVNVGRFLRPGRQSYTAAEVTEALLGQQPV